MKNKILALIVATALLSQSCATILTGTKDRIHFSSNPEGAKVQLNGIDKGETPVDVRVQRKLGDPPIVILKKEGYENRTFELEQSFNAVAVLNLFGILGWAIDLLSGAIMKYSPKFYEMELEKKKDK